MLVVHRATVGFFDKAKQFVGGKGMADVTITVIERQPAESATFPLTDSVLKGTMVIEAKQDCTLLATKYEVWLHYTKDGISHPNFVVAEQDPEPNTSYGPGCLIMPCDMKAGQVITQPWMVSNVDLAGVLSRNGISDPSVAIGNPNFRLQVKCIADVKGSPFDPSAEVDVRMV
jgi:hypothetical protein